MVKELHSRLCCKHPPPFASHLAPPLSSLQRASAGWHAGFGHHCKETYNLHVGQKNCLGMDSETALEQPRNNLGVVWE